MNEVKSVKQRILLEENFKPKLTPSQFRHFLYWIDEVIKEKE